ncbi:MAG TPA: tetratricopeptide repeat protein [Blastocatellia bacterium]|nr:tetratricopeptide repeat protein [Blastocatellia bacterium]
MGIEVKVNSLVARAAVILTTIVLCATLTIAALINAAAGIAADERVGANRQLLAATIAYLPNSATLNARLAEAELGEEDRDISSIETLARRAVNLSPWDYRQRLLLATVDEARGDRAAAEQSLLEALSLAPNYPEVHWRLANLLLREGKLAKSVAEFKTAASSNPRLLPGTLDLLWRVSAGNLAPVKAVTPGDPKSQVLLAEFLVKQSRVPDAITVFGGIDRKALVILPESPAFIDALVSQKYVDEARGLWIGLVSGAYAQPGRPLPLIWNGSFESDPSKGLAQFDWTFARNEYAVPGIDDSTAHTGSRSLRIEFTGRDTTRLDGQIKQNVVLRPGARYRLEFYARTERLETPEGPRVVVSEGSSTEIVRSDPIPSGTADWRAMAVDFTAPATARAVVIAIKRVPRFSYDNPTSGTIWFDDFVLTEQTK